MAGELGGIDARMQGTVVRGEDIERVLAQVPEQTWMWDDGEFEVVTREVPMAQRRVIVSRILLVVQHGA